MDEVTVIHSVVTRATGSMAIGRGADISGSSISSGRCARVVTLLGGGIGEHLEIQLVSRWAAVCLIRLALGFRPLTAFIRGQNDPIQEVRY